MRTFLAFILPATRLAPVGMLFRFRAGLTRVPMTRHNTFDLAVAAVIAVLLARGGPASAAIIDQQNGPGNTSFNGSAGFNWEQGVTAGITGQLVGVDIWDNSATSTTLTINRGAPGNRMLMISHRQSRRHPGRGRTWTCRRQTSNSRPVTSFQSV